MPVLTDTHVLAAFAVAISTALVALVAALTHRRDDAYRERVERLALHGTPNAFGARLRQGISMALIVIGIILVLLERLR